MTTIDQGWPLRTDYDTETLETRFGCRRRRGTDEDFDREDVRTVFLSDIHLGNRHAQVEPLLSFLRQLRPQRVYLVGDIVDGWELQRGSCWPEIGSSVLSLLMALADCGTDLYYTPGNHDDFLRRCPQLRALIERQGCVRIEDEFVAHMADGRRLLVTHGDLFDFFETSAQWLSKLLGVFYQSCLSANWWLNRMRSRPRSSPYGLCAVGKQRLKQLVRFVSRYESSLLGHARRQGCDGVICGHVHTPALFEREGMIYCNTGDWIENCTAIVERHDGTLELRHYYAGSETVVMPSQGDAPSRRGWGRHAETVIASECYASA